MRKRLLTVLLAACFCPCSIPASTAPTPLDVPFAKWIEGPAAFTRATLENLKPDREGRLVFSAGSRRDGVLTSAVLDAGTSRTLHLAAWVVTAGAEPRVSLAIRASENAFSPDAVGGPAWQSASNGQTDDLPTGRFFQYRLTVGAGAPETTLYEVFLDTTPPARRGRPDSGLHPVRDGVVASMMYQTTLEKLHALYAGAPVFNTSERGVYILRNEAGRPIEPGSYQYHPQAAEMYLAARFGTRIIIRIHPCADFSPLTLHPAAVVMRAKDGRQKIAPFAQNRAVNFFDERFMSEYLTGIRAAVRYYRRENPNVVAYTIAPPEFFYDSEPWPDMTYLGGFGDLAKARYIGFMRGLGIAVDGWPAMPDGDISLDRNYYLWVYWRHWEAYRYLDRIARVIQEEDPQAGIGTLNYVADFGLRGVEPGFIEASPDFTFYYSSNLFPRVPGPDGLTGGTVLSYTRPNVLGHSRKLNLAEFDLWSPYVDLKRMETYARYAQMEHVLPVPIVFGDFIHGSPPSNHLTKYHSMKGETLTLPLIERQGDAVRDTLPLRTGEKVSQVAVIMPSFSLYGILEEGAWKPNRDILLQTRVLGTLLGHGIGFDLVSEGQVSKELLDHYKLVIYQQPVAMPWLVDALRETKASILALGWAGTVQAPGPAQLRIGQTPGKFSLALTHAWPSRSGAESGATGTTFLPTGGSVQEAATDIIFGASENPLLRGLQSLCLHLAGRGLGGRPLPYVAGLEGEALAKDDTGRTVFAVKQDHGRWIIHFGCLLDYVGENGADVSLFPPETQDAFWRNIWDFLGVEYFDHLGPLRVMRTTTHLLVENTAANEWRGPVPSPHNAESGWRDSLKEKRLAIPAYGSVVLPLGR